LTVLVSVFVGWRSEHFARRSGVVLPHQNLKPWAGPRKVFTHSSRRVGLNHCLNTGIFEHALGQTASGRLPYVWTTTSLASRIVRIICSSSLSSAEIDASEVFTAATAGRRLSRVPFAEPMGAAGRSLGPARFLGRTRTPSLDIPSPHGYAASPAGAPAHKTR
jgi:hypothetical protein